MERWINGFLNVVDSLLKHPGTLLEKWSLIIPGCLFFCGSMRAQVVRSAYPFRRFPGYFYGRCWDLRYC